MAAQESAEIKKTVPAEEQAKATPEEGHSDKNKREVEETDRATTEPMETEVMEETTTPGNLNQEGRAGEDQEEVAKENQKTGKSRVEEFRRKVEEESQRRFEQWEKQFPRLGEQTPSKKEGARLVSDRSPESQQGQAAAKEKKKDKNKRQNGGGAVANFDGGGASPSAKGGEGEQMN